MFITIVLYCYISPLVDRWEEVVSMNHRRAGASAAVYNGRIYVVGGFDDVQPLADCEVYDPIEQAWTVIAPLDTARGGVGLGMGLFFTKGQTTKLL